MRTVALLPEAQLNIALAESASTLPASVARTSAASPPRPRPAGFWVRVGANLIDAVATALVGMAPLAVAIGVDAPGIVVALAALLLLFMYLGYAPTLLACNNGATWGKLACEQRVVMNDGRPITFGRALLRELVVKGLLGLLILPWGGERSAGRHPSGQARPA